ncbi:MAG: hypothetical protein QNJ70_12885 [Xenococcaceae cyanobacterium MO_207.B15]|nr:hypothetical protein [Xenococcaceae cyanobacterium MO_207.B15]
MIAFKKFPKISDRLFRCFLCKTPQDWQFSSIHRFIAQGIYPPNWGLDMVREMPKAVWDE